MPGTTRAGSYRALFTSGVLTRTFALAMTGRFGYAVLPLVLLFTVSQTTGSFATAATASAVVGLSAFAMPVQARLIDRFSQRRVLPIAAVLTCAALTAMTIAAVLHVASPWTWLLLAALSGAFAPSLGPSMRAQWRALTPATQRPTAYSLDAVAEEVVFLAGPAVAAAVLAAGPAWRGLPLVAVLLSVGTAGLAISPAATATAQPAAAVPPRRSALLGPLGQPLFVTLLTLMLCAGAGFAAALTGTAAQADHSGQPAWAGLIEAGAGAAAVAGGIWWGRLRPRGSWTTHLAGLLLVRAGLMALAASLATMPATAIAMLLGGLLISPMFVVGYLAADEVTPGHQHTEASTWVTTASNAGSALGTAGAGWLFVHAGTPGPFVVSAAVSAIAVLALLGRSTADTA